MCGDDKASDVTLLRSRTGERVCVTVQSKKVLSGE